MNDSPVTELPIPNEPMFTINELLAMRELMLMANAPVANWRAHGILIQKIEKRIQEAQA